MTEATTSPKKWYKSRVLWFNVLLAGLGALEASANLIQPYVPGDIYGWGLMVLTVGNSMMRVLGSRGLAL